MTATTTFRIASLAPAALAAVGLVGWPEAARADEAALSVGTDSGGLDDAGAPAAERDDRAAILAAGKVGGIVPLNGLGPFVNFGLELGYVFGGTNRSLGALVDVTYTVPHAEGSQTEAVDPPRVEGGEYDWELTQKELVLQPTFLYRFTMLRWNPVTPYVGLGPRIYFLESVIEGEAGGEPFGETAERSTKFGVGLPLGIEYQLGPGGLLAELLLQWGPIDHQITGDSHLASATLFLGYRALL